MLPQFPPQSRKNRAPPAVHISRSTLHAPRSTGFPTLHPPRSVSPPSSKSLRLLRLFAAKSVCRASSPTPLPSAPVLSGVEGSVLVPPLLHLFISRVPGSSLPFVSAPIRAIRGFLSVCLRRFGFLRFAVLNLFRISDFGFRIWCRTSRTRCAVLRHPCRSARAPAPRSGRCRRRCPRGGRI